MKALRVFLTASLVVVMAFFAASEGEDSSPTNAGQRGAKTYETRDALQASVLGGQGVSSFTTREDPEGPDESLLQDVSLSMTEFGFSHDSYTGTRVADDFTVPKGEVWKIESITFYAFQTYEAGAQKQESLFTAVNVNLWNSPPDQSGNEPLFSRECTSEVNNFGSTWTGVLRTSESTDGQDSSREIMANVCEFESPVQLFPGTYWLDWQTQGGDPYYYGESEAVPVTILGQMATGNGLHFVNAGGEGMEWVPAVDVGAQGFPFVIEGQALTMAAPQDLHVRDVDLSETLYTCGEAQGPIPENIDLNPSWSVTFFEGMEADAYQHQLFEGTNCNGTPTEEEIQLVEYGQWSGIVAPSWYWFEMPSVAAGAYCWRVRGVLNTPRLAKQGGELFGEWSDCCCFSVGCWPLRAPTMTGVGDAACDGRTADSSPFLKWRDVSDDDGYRWEVEDATGVVIRNGITGPNVNIANIGPLEEGSYVARVQTRGDGAYYCDSDWSGGCAFTVGDGPGPGPPDFSWWPEQPKVGERVRFAELSGETPLSWHWDFGDGFTSDDQHPLHVFGEEGTYTVIRDVELDDGHRIDQKTITVAGTVECGNSVCESGETAWSCPTDCSLAPGESGRAGGSDRRPTVPAAAGGLRGEGGTRWYTEGWVHNPGEKATRFIMEYSPRGQERIQQGGPFNLDAGETRYWPNIVGEIFNDSGSGGLWIDSTEPVIFVTRTYTENPGNSKDGKNGTYGQSFVGTRERFTLGQGDGQLYLIGLREDPSFRSNLYFQEVLGKNVTFRLNILNSTGRVLKTENFSLAGHTQAQKNLREQLQVSDVTSAYATVEVISGDGRLGVAGSVIDAITGDPTSIDAIHPNQVKASPGSEEHDLVAAIAHSRGALGSYWRSGLAMVNQSASTQTASLRFQADPERDGAVSQPVERSVTISPGHQLTWEDILVELFDLAPGSATRGALHVFSPQGLMINSRTYTTSQQGGTYGLSLPALKSGDLVTENGKAGHIVGLQHSERTRTNVGMSEYSGLESGVTLWFADAEYGIRDLGRIARSVPGNSHLQVARVFEELGDFENFAFTSVNVFVTVSNGGSVYVYATVIDNDTGDATGYLTMTNEENAALK